VLTLAIPLLAAALTWVWIDATSSVEACASGGGVHGPGLWGSLALILAGPIAVGIQARHARPSWSDFVGSVIVCGVVAAFLVYLAGQLWWITHHCYL
jgi:hypothetical protein